MIEKPLGPPRLCNRDQEIDTLIKKINECIRRRSKDSYITISTDIIPDIYYYYGVISRLYEEQGWEEVTIVYDQREGDFLSLYHKKEN